MADQKPIILRSQPGIKRDGTKFDGEFYTDGQWCRFQRGLPRKIGGYRAIMRFLSEMSRGFTNFAQNNNTYCHSGSASKLERWLIDPTLNCSVVTDRTPTTLVASEQNQWMFGYQYNASPTPTPSPTPSTASPSPSPSPALSSLNYILAHVAPNNEDVVNSEGGQIFFGDAFGTDPLVEIAIRSGSNATGGIVILHPYAVHYGSNGIIGWSVPGDPTDNFGTGSGVQRPWSQKFIKGLPLRAGLGTAPAGIFWAYDAIIRMAFQGGDAVFQFDTLATDTSIMSANSAIDFDGILYWAGVDRFMQFNGVVKEVPNDLNLNWFFDHIHIRNRSKVFAVKSPKYGEIWWCYPRDNAVECTHAVIYNVRMNTWYDTALPASLRVAGSFSNFTGAPIMLDGIPSEAGFRVWIHEYGVDENDGSTVSAVKSYFETADLSFAALQQLNEAMRVTMIEPDFVQAGPMTVQITGRSNARAQEVVSAEFPFPENPTEPFEEVVPTKEQRRQLRVKFTSSVIGGDFQMGQILAHVGPGQRKVMS